MCLSPWLKEDNKNGRKDMIPCGRCPECTARRTSAWSFRLITHEKTAITAQFVTLTYDTENVPITNKGFMNLSKVDLQLFFKRLREQPKNKENKKMGFPIKYYACGEYGSNTFRPHYHIIIFNAHLDTISPSWNKGEVHFGEVTGASIGYTLKYISKPSRIPLHQNDDRQKEFSLMSKKLGINYLTPQMVKWHKADTVNRMYCTIDEKKITMPRYYKDKIYDDKERNEIKYHHQQLIHEKVEKMYNSRQRIDEYEKAKIAAFKKQNFNSKQNQKL